MVEEEKKKKKNSVSNDSETILRISREVTEDSHPELALIICLFLLITDCL